MDLLEQAILLAAQAHMGQVDKAGEPYILHPLRVMLSLDTVDERIVGVLHDLIEDTPYTLDDLRQRNFPEEILTALDDLTRRKDESYEEFIERIYPNPLARRVKLADLHDNMNILRLKSITERDIERLERYRRAWHRLTT
ncbi:MAG: HD domain-containing protein [Anaerolineae bacterium]|nr:HD domain-containing protein [Anaerolineae bacterium]